MKSFFRIFTIIVVFMLGSVMYVAWTSRQLTEAINEVKQQFEIGSIAWLIYLPKDMMGFITISESKGDGICGKVIFDTGNIRRAEVNNTDVSKSLSFLAGVDLKEYATKFRGCDTIEILLVSKSGIHKATVSIGFADGIITRVDAPKVWD